MGDIVEMPGRQKLPDKNDYEFVVDLARFAEGITTEEAEGKSTAWPMMSGQNSARTMIS
jgi:hypothetical protein